MSSVPGHMWSRRMGLVGRLSEPTLDSCHHIRGEGQWTSESSCPSELGFCLSFFLGVDGTSIEVSEHWPWKTITCSLDGSFVGLQFLCGCMFLARKEPKM